MEFIVIYPDGSQQLSQPEPNFPAAKIYPGGKQLPLQDNSGVNLHEACLSPVSPSDQRKAAIQGIVDAKIVEANFMGQTVDADHMRRLVLAAQDQLNSEAPNPKPVNNVGKGTIPEFGMGMPLPQSHLNVNHGCY